MTAPPTGHLGPGTHLVLIRTFRASLHDLWTAR